MLKPSNIRDLIRRIRSWNDAEAVFANSGWLVGENVARMALAATVSAALARGLGAEELGALRAALAFVTLCSAFTSLGLSGILVKTLTQEPDKADETLGTTAVLYMLGSFASAALCVGVTMAVIDEPEKVLLVLIFTLGVLFHAPRIANQWFQYKVKSKYAVFAKTIPSIASGVGILVAALMNAPLVVFAILIVSDTILGALALTVLVARTRDIPNKLVFRFARARSLLSQSWPMIASAVAVKIYLKIDQLMIERMVDDREVGIYSVAADISEIWYILPTALATSALSGIVAIYTVDKSKYRERMQDLLDLMVLLSGTIVVFVFALAPAGMNFVYGPDYQGSATILRVHILAAPFIFMGRILSKAIVTEGYYRFSIVRHSAGAIVNVGLNFYLIPRYGGLGAAWATVASYATGAYLAAILHPQARKMFWQMSRALVVPFR